MNRSFGKDELVAKFRSTSFWSNGARIIDDRVVGNHYWGALQCSNGEKVIFLALMAAGGRDEGWGYKDMTESCGPSAVDCPLSLLKITDEPTSGYAVEWRKRVLEYHNAQSAMRKTRSELNSGMKVNFQEVMYQLQQPAGPRRGWIVQRLADGKKFRLKSKQLSQAIVLGNLAA